ncbi:MAG: hypothetical protein LBN39_03805 [Planctomycetaceae bacterium]|jgi:hypothetical protein|nr:hypothetical protein [Planctomycetaceae bacterium]
MKTNEQNKIERNFCIVACLLAESLATGVINGLNYNTPTASGSADTLRYTVFFNFPVEGSFAGAGDSGGPAA